MATGPGNADDYKRERVIADLRVPESSPNTGPRATAQRVFGRERQQQYEVKDDGAPDAG